MRLVFRHDRSRVLCGEIRLQWSLNENDGLTPFKSGCDATPDEAGPRLGSSRRKAKQSVRSGPLHLVCSYRVITTSSLCSMSKDLNARVARSFRRLRLKQGLSQEEAAEKCGLHRTYIGAIERGERNITLSTLQQIAAGLRVNPLDLLSEGGGDA